ncbi:MAG: tRNA lysidine(34) synthetase TilS [Rudaea sp.]
MTVRVVVHIEAKMRSLPPGPLCVAFSGGMDSTVLLHALSQIPAARERGLRAVHVDHRLHAESGRWSDHCASIAASLEIPLVIERAEVARQGAGLEAAARDARYERFRHIMRAGEIVSLAHHADDQAETILLKLLRGAGPEGLGGMRTLRTFAPGFIWRPLLDLPRTALADYAKDENLKWIDDPSNADSNLRRNFLRHDIMPRLVERWPDASIAIAHSAAWSRTAADHIDRQAHAAIDTLRDKHVNSLRWRDWLDLSDALRDATLRLWLRELKLPPPAFFHVAEIERQMREAAPDKSPCVRWAGCEIRRYREEMFAMTPLPPHREWALVWDGSATELPDGSCIALRNGEAVVRLPSPLTVRNRRGGERIKPSGATHHRDVRLLLQEANIPPWARVDLPLIFDGGDLVGVADIAVSDTLASTLTVLNARIVWTSRLPT